LQHRLLTDATGRPIEFAVGYYRGDLIVISTFSSGAARPSEVDDQRNATS
jgi:hypothetical protein